MINSIRSLRLIASILSHSLLQAKLVHDTFTLEADVVQRDAHGPREGHEERPAHVLYILRIGVDAVPLAAELETRGRESFFEVPDTELRLVVEQGPARIESLIVFLRDLTGFESGAQISFGLEEAGVRDEAFDGVMRSVGAGAVDKQVEIYRSEVVGRTREFEHDVAESLAAIPGPRLARGMCEIGALVV